VNIIGQIIIIPYKKEPTPKLFCLTPHVNKYEKNEVGFLVLIQYKCFNNKDTKQAYVVAIHVLYVLIHE